MVASQARGVFDDDVQELHRADVCAHRLVDGERVSAYRVLCGHPDHSRRDERSRPGPSCDQPCTCVRRKMEGGIVGHRGSTSYDFTRSGRTSLMWVRTMRQVPLVAGRQYQAMLPVGALPRVCQVSRLPRPETHGVDSRCHRGRAPSAPLMVPSRARWHPGATRYLELVALELEEAGRLAKIRPTGPSSAIGLGHNSLAAGEAAFRAA